MSQCLALVRSSEPVAQPAKAAQAHDVDRRQVAAANVKTALKIGMECATIRSVVEGELSGAFDAKVTLHLPGNGDGAVLDAARSHKLLKLHEGLQTRVLYPLESAERKVGVIEIMLAPKANFTAQDVKALETIGTFAARALATAADAPQT